jgi:hypothetical protein
MLKIFDVWIYATIFLIYHKNIWMKRNKSNKHKNSKKKHLKKLNILKDAFKNWFEKWHIFIFKKFNIHLHNDIIKHLFWIIKHHFTTEVCKYIMAKGPISKLPTSASGGTIIGCQIMVLIIQLH